MTEEDENNLMQSLTPNELRMVSLLGSGINQSTVAATCGVTDSYISQLMAQEGFASLVNKIRFEKLQAQSDIDDSYDEMEKELQSKMRKVIPMLTKPRDILDFTSRLNAMKRRGSVNPTQQTSETTVIVNLQLPTAIVNKIAVEPISNRVIEANGQELVTLPSNQTIGLLNDARSEKSEGKLRLPRQAVGASDL